MQILKNNFLSFTKLPKILKNKVMLSFGWSMENQSTFNLSKEKLIGIIAIILAKQRCIYFTYIYIFNPLLGTYPKGRPDQLAEIYVKIRCVQHYQLFKCLNYCIVQLFGMVKYILNHYFDETLAALTIDSNNSDDWHLLCTSYMSGTVLNPVHFLT